MVQKEKIRFHIEMSISDLWKFSMYHCYRGYLGVFNVLFTAASVYLLATKWSTASITQKGLLLICVLMFTVWQPMLLLLKAMKQYRTERIRTPMDMTFTKEGFKIEQGGQSMDVTWDQVGRVDHITGEYIVYMGRVHAYLIPDRIVGKDMDAFTALLKEALPKERLKRV